MDLSSGIDQLVLAALADPERSSVRAILEWIAREARADGCILWLASPTQTLPPSIAGDWFVDEQTFDMYVGPLHCSIAAQAIASRQTLITADLRADVRYEELFSDPDSGAVCSVALNHSGVTWGALNFYRTSAAGFDQQELDKIKSATQLIPLLHRAITDRVRVKLGSAVDTLLDHQSIQSRPDDLIFNQDLRRVISELCYATRAALHCDEVSILLKGNKDSDGYELVGTTIPHAVEEQRDVESFKFSELDEASTQNSGSDNALLASFMAVPISCKDHVIGIVQCSLPRRPDYFTDEDLSLIRFVAGHLADFWNSCLSRCRTQEAYELWRSVIERIRDLNNFASSELSQPNPSKNRIYAEALRITEALFGQPEIMDIRAFDKETSELYFAAVSGKEWEQGTPAEIAERRARRFDVQKEPPTSAGAHVFQTGRSYFAMDLNQDPSHAPTFPNVKRMIVAPIKVSDKRYGVLDIQGTGDQDFSQHAIPAAELLGQELGMYCYLAETVGALHRTQDELEQIGRGLKQTFQDLAHELKSPIIQALRYAQWAIDSPNPKSVATKLYAIRGLCAKANRVTQNIKVHAALMDGRVRLQKPEIVEVDRLVGILIEAAIDTEMLVEPNRQVRFSVDRSSFEGLRTVKVRADLTLLEQALANVLDNAAKYSYPRTVVDIRGAKTKTGRFSISVSNEGVPLRMADIPKVTQRGWRGEVAIEVTAEGSGIGLWIVDNIMKAHAGELLVVPTGNYTEVKLLFPTSDIE